PYGSSRFRWGEPWIWAGSSPGTTIVTRSVTTYSWSGSVSRFYCLTRRGARRLVLPPVSAPDGGMCNGTVTTRQRSPPKMASITRSEEGDMQCIQAGSGSFELGASYREGDAA